jgi:hypothetical protein
METNVQKQRSHTFASSDLANIFTSPIARREFLLLTIADFEANKRNIHDGFHVPNGKKLRYGLAKAQELFLNIGEPHAASICDRLAKGAPRWSDEHAELLRFVDRTMIELEEEANAFLVEGKQDDNGIESTIGNYVPVPA